MALACNPRLLIADEPTTALDVTIQAQVLELMRKLKAKYQTSMIMITHDLGIVAEICDYVAVMYAGEIVEYGNREQLFHRPSHPYTKGLFACIPNLMEEETTLIPIEGMTLILQIFQLAAVSIPAVHMRQKNVKNESRQ